jgi:hypothetical protein
VSKLGGIFIFSWVLFRFVWHTFSFDLTDDLSDMYFILNDVCYIGFALLILRFSPISFVPKKISKRIYLLLVIYTGWCLVVDCLIISGIGAHNTAIYTIIDIAFLTLGVLCLMFG